MAKLNGQEVKLVEVQGHFHGTITTMLGDVSGLSRRFRVEFPDRIVGPGPDEMVVVPRGAEHRTAADDEADIIEPAGS